MTPTRAPAHGVRPAARHGSNTAIDLEFRGGKLRGGSISVNNGHSSVSVNARGSRGRRHWSTSYYPDYASTYRASRGYVAPGYGYSFGSVYWFTPTVVAGYEPNPHADQPYRNGGNIAPPVGHNPGATRRAPTNGPGWGTVLGEGNIAFSQGRYVEARRVYVRAMLLDERDGYAKMLYAWSNFALGDYQLAATALRSALTTSPDLIRYPIDMRMHYQDLGLLAQQADALHAYVATNPGDPDAALLLGYLYYSVGDLQHGLSTFNDLAAVHPDDQSVFVLRDAAARAANVQSQRH